MTVCNCVQSHLVPMYNITEREGGRTKYQAHLRLFPKVNTHTHTQTANFGNSRAAEARSHLRCIAQEWESEREREHSGISASDIRPNRIVNSPWSSIYSISLHCNLAITIFTHSLSLSLLSLIALCRSRLLNTRKLLRKNHILVVYKACARPYSNWITHAHTHLYPQQMRMIFSRLYSQEWTQGGGRGEIVYIPCMYIMPSTGAPLYCLGVKLPFDSTHTQRRPWEFRIVVLYTYRKYCVGHKYSVYYYYILLWYYYYIYTDARYISRTECPTRGLADRHYLRDYISQWAKEAKSITVFASLSRHQ